MYAAVPRIMPAPVVVTAIVGASVDRRARRPRALGLGQTEVEQLDRAARRDLDVGRLEIAVDDALVVRGFEAVGNLPGDLERLVERNRALLDPLRQRRTLDELHDQRAVLDAVDRGDVRMVEGGEHLRLAREARHARGVLGEVFGDQLDRDLSTELAVGGAIHLAHGAFAEFRGDAVVGDGFRRHLG